MMHREFGRRLAHIMILRMAQLCYGLNKMNMPTKPPVCSLAAYICPVFIAQATLFYSDVLHNKQIPAFSQLAQMIPPEGYFSAKRSCWYRPWIKAVPPNIPLARGPMPAVQDQGAGESNCQVGHAKMEDHPVVRMARAKQPTPVFKSKHSPKEILLGYRWRKRQPLRHRHALAAAHMTFDQILSCPWVAVQNKYCYRLLILNTNLQTSKKRNNKTKFDDLLADSYIKDQKFHMVRADLRCQTSMSQPRSWRLPVCVKYSEIEFEIDTQMDVVGPWGWGWRR